MIDFVSHKLRVLAEAARRAVTDEPRREPTTHDYIAQEWGHSMSLTTKLTPDGKTWRGVGWGFDVKVGDYCLLSGLHGGTRYRYTKVSYFGDPPDMFSFEIEFAPREARP